MEIQREIEIAAENRLRVPSSTFCAEEVRDYHEALGGRRGQTMRLVHRPVFTEHIHRHRLR